jgi:aryl-alcohol dehydrogenase-like predicted oxidoreductase
LKLNLLGNTNINLSILGLGTDYFSQLGNTRSKKEVNDILMMAEDYGINHLDTAECYGNHYSEQLIGKSTINREKWIIASKFGHNFKKGNKIYAYDLKSVQTQLDDSLKALNTSYIDIYYFHSGDDKHFDNDKLWTYLNKQVEEGKIRFLGLSFKHSLVHQNNFFQIEKAINYNIKIIQTVYNYLSQESANRLIPLCRSKGLDVIGRMPLAKGLLTGKYRSNKDFMENDSRLIFREFNEEAFNKIQHELSHIPNEKLAQWAISWSTSSGVVDATVIGCKNISQLKSNISSIN